MDLWRRCGGGVSGSIVCHRADAAGIRRVSWRDGTTWRSGLRMPLHVRATLSRYEDRRAGNHVANNLPNRQERALDTLRRALPRIVGRR